MYKWLSLRRFSKTHHLRGTTILCVKKNNQIAMIGDGQICLGPTRFKTNAVKIHKMQPNILCGFAGGTADCLALLELLEKEYERTPGETLRVCINLAKSWRSSNKKHLSCDMIVVDPKVMLLINGQGDAIEIDDGVLAIGSGRLYAHAAAKALIDIEGMIAKDIAHKAINVAADMCIYTNKNFSMEIIDF